MPERRVAESKQLPIPGKPLNPQQIRSLVRGIDSIRTQGRDEGRTTDGLELPVDVQLSLGDMKSVLDLVLGRRKSVTLRTFPRPAFLQRDGSVKTTD